MSLDCVVSQLSPSVSDRGKGGLMEKSEDKYLAYLFFLFQKKTEKIIVNCMSGT